MWRGRVEVGVLRGEDAVMRNLPRLVLWVVLGGLLVGCDRTINEVRAPHSGAVLTASR